MRWTYTPFPAEEVESFGGRAGVGPVLSELLLRLGIRCEVAAGKFLQSALAELQDPFLLANLEAAVSRLRQAIDRREDIVVLGDYDVDGVSSTALLVSILRRFGLSPRFIVPRRLEEGYGLSRNAIDRALEGGAPALFIALDCGTNSHAEVEYLRSRAIDVLVIDHHRSKEAALSYGILVNPHVAEVENDAAWRNLCTVGIVFKVVHGLLKQLRLENNPVAHRIKLKDYLDLVAMGTVADLVPLVGENRILARHGLRILQTTNRPGIRALMQISGIKTGQQIMPVDISFRIGPRINASGRLADASLSVELLLSEDIEFCNATAQQLEGFNRERQDIERVISEAAEKMVETHYADHRGIVLFSKDWHPGVVGIVASRVTRKFNRPCIVLGEEGELAKGSGRSIYGINLVELLGPCQEMLRSWGGHPMAVGISLHKDQVDRFREAFVEAVRVHPMGEAAEPHLEIAAWISPEQVRENLLDELDALHPFGQGNPEPVFGIRGAIIKDLPEVFKEHHFRFRVVDSSGRRIQGVAWKLAHRPPPTGVPLDLAVELGWNFFNGRKSLQVEMMDWRLAETAERAQTAQR